MGDFIVRVKATGGHGCQREIKDGELVPGCGQAGCPDCTARRFVQELKKTCMMQEATLTHWPGDKSEVVDDLLTGIRKGSF